MSKFVTIYLEIEQTFVSCIVHFFKRLFCVLMLKNAYFCGTGKTCITVMICLRLHGARIIWTAIWIAIWVLIWIAIQKMYLFTHSLFHTTKRITLLLIVQSLLHRNPPYIWIKIIQITIQIDCLNRTRFLNKDCYLDHDLDNFAPCKQGISELFL